MNAYPIKELQNWLDYLVNSSQVPIIGTEFMQPSTSIPLAKRRPMVIVQKLIISLGLS